MNKKVEKTISINTFPSKVWEYLTDPNLMKKWMGEPEMNIEISTDWVVGNPILIKGFHYIKFENKGTVLQFDPHKIVQYSHLNSISRLPDMTENYAIITFLLTPNENQTLLTVKIENFPTESIYKHLDFYWQSTMTILKKFIEQQ